MLKKIKESFELGHLDKYEYMERIHAEHKRLFGYSEFMQGTKFKEIKITDKDVVFTMESLGMDIKMSCLKHDITSVPFTFLDFGSYDKNETKFLVSSKLIKSDAVIFDVGANLGWYAIHFMKMFPNCKVYSFEPIKETFELLQHNIRLNDLKPYRTHNIALSNKNGETDFYMDLERVGASSMVNLRDTSNTVIQTCCTQKLDDFFFKVGLDKLDFIKIDVEGAEKLVIDGGMDTIKRLKPIIYAELLRKWSAKFNYHPQDVVKLLAEIGYTCNVIDDAGKTIKIKEITEKTTETNFLFMPNC